MKEEEVVVCGRDEGLQGMDGNGECHRARDSTPAALCCPLSHSLSTLSLDLILTCPLFLLMMLQSTPVLMIAGSSLITKYVFFLVNRVDKY